MTVAYYSSFDLRRLAAWTITLTPASGGTAITLNSDSFTKPCHIHHTAGVGSWNLASNIDYTISDDPSNDAKYASLSFGSNCASTANLLVGAWTVPTTITFSFSLTTHRYTITRSSGDSFSVSFTGIGAALFGFSGDSASATAHTGTRTPLYVIAASSPGLSADSGDQTPSGQSSIAIADSCATWSALTRTASPVQRRWEQRFETYTKVWREFASSSDPWTFQDLYDLARAGLPFVVRDSTMARQGLYLLRGGEDGFLPQPHGEGNHAQVMVPFACTKIGTRSV